MKKFLIITTGIVTVLMTASCNRVRRTPGRDYMPDMRFSRAYESYASTEALRKEGVFYNSRPVEGTMARGDEMPFPLSEDKVGDTTNYFASRQVKNPLNISSIDMTEAERLFLVNCGICHGAKLDGNGPLYKGGDGPYPAKPATLVGDAKYESMPEGQMFYSVKYGKNAMGSYASQLSTKEIWMVLAYIKSKQTKAATPAAADTTKQK
ncbi:MAG: cytochrome c [Chitinophagaceae bacterium]|jgi:mono/diheme cytochrome c family protein|nr:cytochrome c [Chitinophagaceae bacterium]OQY92438.1 MAG: quinol:cytochrome C oxidoreductase [Sphingobacteriales bacterium UTBCD1]